LLRDAKRLGLAVIFAVLTVISFAQTPTSQYCDIWFDNSNMTQASYCSPSNAVYTLSLLYYEPFDDKKIKRMGVDWGDGSPTEWASFPSDFNKTTNPSLGIVTYTQKSPFPHTYVAQSDCHIKTTVWVEFEDGFCQMTGVRNATVWTTDNDARGNGELVFVTEEDKGSVNEYLVCAGQAIDVSFWDLSTLACITVPFFDMQDAFIYNMRVRNTQYVYGIANGGSPEFPGTAPLIPQVTVGTTPVTNAAGGRIGPDGGTYEQDVKTFPQPQPGTFQVRDAIEDETQRITVPAGVTEAGQVFTIELRNWNYCNSYPGNAPVTETARIRIVDAPPPPLPAEVEFCHENHYSTNPSYTITISHDHLPAQFTPGEYRWYADNAGVPGAYIRTKAHTDRTFNPFSPTDVPNSSQRIPMENGMPKPGRYTYWVDYKYDDRTDPPLYVCETEKIPITWIIRNDISAAPSALIAANSSNGKMEGCSGETITLTYPSAPLPGLFGGDTQYFWEVTSGNATITRNAGNRGQSATLVLTGDPDATAITKTQTVTIRVHREWVDALRVDPSTASTDRGVCRYSYPAPVTAGCDHCPGNYVQFTFTINPLPKATLGGGGEICADEVGLDLLSLTGLGGGKMGGSPSQYSLNVTFDNGQTENIKFSSNTGSANIIPGPFPANGTYTEYAITQVEDAITGCVSTAAANPDKITGSAAIIKRGRLPAPVFSNRRLRRLNRCPGCHRCLLPKTRLFRRRRGRGSVCRRPRYL